MTKENGALSYAELPPLPVMPEGLLADEKKIWNTTINILTPTTILREQDAAVLEAYCQSYVRWHDAEKEIRKSSKRNKKLGLLSIGANGTYVINPLVNISRRAQADTVAYAAQLGMTPAARMRLDSESSASNLKKVNTFEKLKKIKDERMDPKSKSIRKGVNSKK